MQVKKSKLIEFLMYLYLSLSWFFTFVYSYDFDKFAVVLILLMTACLPLISKYEGDELLISLKENKFIFFISIFICTYTYQYLMLGKIINVELMTLLGVYFTVIYVRQLQGIIDLGKVVYIYCTLFLISSILTISESPLSSYGYRYETGAGGILSSFILFCIFIGAVVLERKGKAILYLSGLMLLAFQIRGPLLSMLITLIFKKGLSRKFVVYSIAVLVLLLAYYFINPSSRVFSTETSGRWIHWEIILRSFEYDLFSVLFGMGGGFSTNVLIEHGVGDSMAAAHNEYIRYGVDLGLSGLFMISLTLWNVAKHSRSLLVIVILLQQMFTDNVFTYFHNYLFFLIVFSFYLGQKNNANVGSVNLIRK